MGFEVEDAKINGVQVVTKGARVTVSVDWSDRNGQTFTISSGTVSIYDSDGVVTDISGRSITVVSGLLSAPRTQFIIDSSESSALDPGYYTIRWNLTLGDGQTRVVDEALRVRSA